MTTSADQASNATPQDEAAPRRAHLRSFLKHASGFWRGDSKVRAWTLTLTVAFFAAAVVAVQYGMNKWNRIFFDALEKKDVPGVMDAIWLLPLIVLAQALAVSGMVVFRMLFQMRWREWLTNMLAGWWIADQRYYRLSIVDREQSAPEYRIAEDVRLSIEPLADFSIGIASAFATAATFVSVLWTVGGAATFTLGGSTWHVPAYMAVAAVVYGAITSLGAWLAGRPLVGQVSTKNQMEAEFRAEMTRLRENAESIALIRGDQGELRGTRENYKRVVAAWSRIIRQNGVIASVYNINGALFPIVPLLLAAPKYLSGELTLGAVMQVTAAFSAVLGALNWFTDNFVRLAEWFASVKRVDELIDSLEAVDAATLAGATERLTLTRGEDETLRLRDLSVAHRDGRVVVDSASVDIAPGDKVLIGGESGTGKSTLIRAVAGLWPWGSGEVILPKTAQIVFVPQRAYVPRATLREVTTYPANADAFTTEQIQDALKRCGVGYVAAKLDDGRTHWDQVLSGGKRQASAFARLVLQKPQVVIMDESTSALDEERQARLMGLFHEELAQSTLISVGHRPGLEEYHDHKITLHRELAGARMTSKPLRSAVASFLRKRNPFKRKRAQAI